MVSCIFALSPDGVLERLLTVCCGLGGSPFLLGFKLPSCDMCGSLFLELFDRVDDALRDCIGFAVEGFGNSLCECFSCVTGSAVSGALGYLAFKHAVSCFFDIFPRLL